RPRRTQPTMKELHDAESAVTGERRGESPKTREQPVVVDPQRPGPTLTIQGDVRGARLDDAEAAACPHLEPPQIVVGERAIRVALLIGHGGSRVRRTFERPAPCS